ncbi:MAG: caspase family protein, partial [Rhizobiales bacterium]|nr:caspase family protein [Hyphomicrobiales bacterium]
MKTACLAMLAICLSLFLSIETAVAAKRVALIVGNSAYQHAAPLKNPVNDAEAVAETLERLDFEIVKGIDLS